MCGIIGYTGSRQAVPVLMEGLESLEYRGYDSAGISVQNGRGISTVKARGRILELAGRLEKNGTPKGTCGIGHTRWATHGEPSDVNSHPHDTGRLALVHNGIIENYLELKESLYANGYFFASQTDTEVAAKLIDSLYDGNPTKALTQASRQIDGSYAFGVLFADQPNIIYCMRKGSPLIVGVGKEENFIASDVSAILPYTKEYYILEEEEIAAVTAGNILITDKNGDPVKRAPLTAAWNITQAQKGGYPHFMLKEIFEQPAVLMETIRPRIRESLPDFTGDGLDPSLFSKYSHIHMVACGTAMHAGLIGQSLIEKLARLPVDVCLASEFRYKNPILRKDQLVVIISQSGETADTLAALRLAKSAGVDTLAVVNVIGSSIAREADYVIHTFAGPEIAVASTKAYSVQVAVMYLLAIHIALVKRQVDAAGAKALTKSLLQSVEAVRNMLALSEALVRMSTQYADVHSLFFLGRGLDYALSMEGSLKLKEISYIHCESYAAGELKHGTISLITPGTPVVALATQDSVLPKLVSNVKEVKARGGHVLLIAKEGSPIDPDVYDEIIRIPASNDLFTPLPTVVLLQLFAYHVAVVRGCDVDKPRNLAKSVTVE